MNGQIYHNRTIRVEYAFKDGTTKERHGSEAERFYVKSLKLNPILNN